MIKAFALIMILPLLSLSLISLNSEKGPRVVIENGEIEGIHRPESNLNVFLGIPYAAPPVGELRWKAPQSMDNWGGVKSTKAFGNTPFQENIFGDMVYRTEGFSEDCLYLNVWTPSNKSKELLPVLVYFYGGGFVAGDGSEPRYDGASMAQKGIVTVTVNYRLNIFGFFAHPDLSAEASYGSSGNYGLLDQNAALKWVKQNINAFGGDPDRVTIAGESAGSISVSAQMASPLSKDLIHGAIGESGAAIHPTLAPVPLAEAEKIGVEFVGQAGFTSLHQLRALSTQELYNVYKNSRRFGFPTVIDGYFYPSSLPEIFENKSQAQVPLLCGWNSAEMSGQAFMQGLPNTKDNFIKKVKEVYPEHFNEVLKMYPHNNATEVEFSATDLASDRFIAYSTWKWADLHLKNSDQPVYRYLYSKKRPESVDGNPGPPPIGAPHACEIEYCMGNLHLVDTFKWTEDDYKVSNTMQNFFANFIKTGNPNDESLPEWPMLDKSNNPSVMIIDTDSKSMKSNVESRYHFHDEYYREH